MTQSFEMKYLNINLNTIKLVLTDDNLMLSDKKREFYAETIKLIEEVLTMHLENIDSIGLDDNKVIEQRNLRYQIITIDKLRLIELITQL